MSPSGDEVPTCPGAVSAAPVPAGSGAPARGLLALLGNSVTLIALLGFDFDPSGRRYPGPYPL